MTATKERFFKPGKATADVKAATTDPKARDIVAAETSERDRKTERLRRMRLEQEALSEEKEAIKPKGKRPVASRKP